MELKYIDIVPENILQATKFEMKLFPNSCGFTSFMDGYRKGKPYFMVFDKDILVGICGLYTMPEFGEPKTVWLGWFGVDAKHRRKGYGKQILLDMIERAKKQGFDTFRLYTSKISCQAAMILYEDVMDFGEPYTLEEPEKCRYVFTKSLTNKKAKKWNNRMLNLAYERSRETEGLKNYRIALKNR